MWIVYYVCDHSILRPLRQVIQYLDSSIDHSYDQKCGLYCIELILKVKVEVCYIEIQLAENSNLEEEEERSNYHYYTTVCDDLTGLQGCGSSRNVTQRNIGLD